VWLIRIKRNIDCLKSIIDSEIGQFQGLLGDVSVQKGQESHICLLFRHMWTQEPDKQENSFNSLNIIALLFF
jgi:hypothetical protein